MTTPTAVALKAKKVPILRSGIGEFPVDMTRHKTIKPKKQTNFTNGRFCRDIILRILLVSTSERTYCGCCCCCCCCCCCGSVGGGGPNRDW